MPPELELPGIDSAAPATPAAPAPSAPEDTSTQSASVQQDAGQPAPGAPTPESDAGDIDGEPAQPRRRDSGAQRRFGELLERERTAREESSQLRSMLAMVLQGQMNPAQARAQADAHQQEAPPRLEQFGNWADALAAYNWGPGNVKKKGSAAAPVETQNYFGQILADLGIGGTTA